MPDVKLTILSSRCRGGYCRAGDVHIAGDLCPPICHELWHAIYPSVYVLQNGGSLDSGETRSKTFVMPCPDEGRVIVRGEALEESG